MEMWCPDDMGRDSWDWVGPPAWERACFNSPVWGGGSSPVKTEPLQIVLLLLLLVVWLLLVTKKSNTNLVEPGGCGHIQGDVTTKHQPFCVLVGVVLWRDGRVHVRVREKRVCVQLRILTPLLDWKRCLELSVELILSRLVRSIRTVCTIQEFAPKFLRVVGARLAILAFIVLVLLDVCIVAVHLVHAKNKFVSLRED